MSICDRKLVYALMRSSRRCWCVVSSASCRFSFAAWSNSICFVILWFRAETICTPKAPLTLMSATARGIATVNQVGSVVVIVEPP
jgi:hypothetical protein